MEVKPFKHIKEQLNEEYPLPQGKSLPGITRVLGWSPEKQARLAEWRANVGQEKAQQISQRSANRGNDLHKICEKYVLNNPEFIDMNPFIKPVFKSIYPILRDRVDNIMGVEKSLYSNLLGIKGRTDLIAEFDNKKAIIDFKGSDKPKKAEWITDYFMQGAAYSVMYYERTGIILPNLVLIIAVDNEEPQVFVEKVRDWVPPLRKEIAAYKAANP